MEKKIVFKKSNLTKLFTISSRRNKCNLIYLCELSDYSIKKTHKKQTFHFLKNNMQTSILKSENID